MKMQLLCGEQKYDFAGTHVHVLSKHVSQIEYFSLLTNQTTVDTINRSR